LEDSADEGIDEFFWEMVGGGHGRFPSRWPVGWPHVAERLVNRHHL
jgi:hypothetical protein